MFSVTTQFLLVFIGLCQSINLIFIFLSYYSPSGAVLRGGTSSASDVVAVQMCGRPAGGSHPENEQHVLQQQKMRVV